MRFKPRPKNASSPQMNRGMSCSQNIHRMSNVKFFALTSKPCSIATHQMVLVRQVLQSRASLNQVSNHQLPLSILASHHLIRPQPPKPIAQIMPLFYNRTLPLLLNLFRPHTQQTNRTSLLLPLCTYHKRLSLLQLPSTIPPSIRALCLAIRARLLRITIR